MIEEQSTTPRQCALLVAVPTTAAAFDEACNRTPPSDFVQRLLGRPPRRTSWVWENVYGPVAVFVGSVLERVAGYGVTVIERATPADLAYALAKFDVVTVVAHWMAPLVEASDILDPQAVLAELADSTKPWSSALREVFDACGPFDANEPREVLAKALNDVLRAAHAHLNSGPSRHLRRISDEQSLKWRLTYDLLEETFSRDVLRVRDAVEFFDMGYPCGHIVDTVPPDFCGTLDLSICNSTILGHAVRRRQKECLLIINECASPLAFALLKYQAAIAHLSREPMSFAAAVTATHRALKELVG